MLFAVPSPNALKLIIPAALIFFTTHYLLYTSNTFAKHNYDDPSSPEHNVPVSSPTGAAKPVFTKEYIKQNFIKAVIRNDVDGPMNLDPLTDLCRNTKWQPGLIVKCQPFPGGVGNIRNMFLNCIRFAIEAGATGLVIPECRHRNDNDLSDIHTANLYPFSYVMDTEFFRKSFSTACPQIRLYPSDAHLPMKVTTEMLSTRHITPYELAPKLRNHTLIDMPRPAWRTAFDAWLRKETMYPEMSADKPAFVFMTNQLLRWPFQYDSNEFVAHFGRILRIREDARLLAGAILWSMSEKYALDLDYSQLPFPEDKFMGVHLRTAADATKAGWPNYTVQSTNYLAAAKRTHAKIIYLTTEAPEDAKNFTELVNTQDITVLSKEILLAGDEFVEERKILAGMTWDQHALIDFEVLLRSSYFVGMFESSFTWNLAMRRHVILGNGSWLPLGHGKMGLDGLEHPAEAFMDKYSAVYGPVNLGMRWQFPLGLYP